MFDLMVELKTHCNEKEYKSAVEMEISWQSASKVCYILSENTTLV